MSLYKKNQDDSFECITVYNGRNYELFGLLAGVRGSSHFFTGGYGYIVEPRGLPDNLSSYVQFKWEEGKDEDGDVNWHTPTWYDFCELDTYTYLLNDFNNEMNRKNKYIEELEKKISILEGEEEDDSWTDDLFNECKDDYNGINALAGFVSCIKDVLDTYGIYNPKSGEIRIVMWFDN